ncbi:Hachiman antiphage defense system protein HamA [Sorangium sp. So ce385]|uniref:Hachiman antiphage defense system protein HamA n=1 Tax=Sorangium sp. So ce385 TaxID=3133308 RepID=UPI003F5AE7CF
MTVLREMLTRHHASPEAMERSQQKRKAMERLGLGREQAGLRRFPTNPTTQKGNLAEVVLAEYIVASSKLALPTYRLRYNPNIDQSMKGDDVLAFDLDANPVRLVVGEAKFRGASSAAAVIEIVDGLLRSHRSGVPASLQFVADRLFDEGQAELGNRVLECAILFARNKLRLDYVGLLLSDAKSAARVNDFTPATSVRLAMISFGVDVPDALVHSCYDQLE